MVQALVELDDNTNRVINVVKARNGLHDKGEAIEFIVGKYVEYENEPELKPEFIEKMRKIAKDSKFIRIDDFGKHFGLR